MPNFITKKMPAALVPLVVGGVTYVFYTLDPATLPSFPVAADTIECFDIPKSARIVAASLRISGDIGAATSTLQLRARATATVALTAALAATAAGSALMNVAPPPRDDLIATIIDLLVGTAALDATGTIEVMVGYVAP